MANPAITAVELLAISDDMSIVNVIILMAIQLLPATCTQWCCMYNITTCVNLCIFSMAI